MKIIKGGYLRLKPFIAFTLLGAFIEGYNIWQGKVTGRPGELIGDMIGFSLGMGLLGGFLYCLRHKKVRKSKSE